jgi:hypothetical protein
LFKNAICWKLTCLHSKLVSEKVFSLLFFLEFEFVSISQSCFFYCLANVQSVMCSYNAINGVPACSDPHLLTDILRNEYHFDGFVISDYDAIGRHYHFFRILCSQHIQSYLFLLTICYFSKHLARSSLCTNSRRS